MAAEGLIEKTDSSEYDFYVMGVWAVAPILLKSKLSVSKLDCHILKRPVLAEKLKDMDRYGVTVITAGAGYGKTTAVLQMLEQKQQKCGWYTPGPEDDGVFVFSLYLAAALGQLYPELPGWYSENVPVKDQFNWKRIFAVFSAGLEHWSEGRSGGVLILDDWFVIQHEPEIRSFMNRLLACKPEHLHIVFLSREEVLLPEIGRLKASGGLLEIDERDLAFCRQEVEAYLAQVTIKGCRPEEAEQIYRVTEGWIMAVRMLAAGRELDWKANISALVRNRTTGNLFSYLAYDVLDRQPEYIQDFLLKTALLESFTCELCQGVLAGEFKPAHLMTVLASGLFLTEIGQGIYRYHQLFREFLLAETAKRLDDAAVKNIHLRAGYYYQQDGKEETALHHLLAAGQTEAAGKLLIRISRKMVQAGRGRLMHGYIQQLPAIHDHPHIRMACGDEARFSCCYKEAHEYYRQAAEGYRSMDDRAGESHALRGRGEIYLDIIQPREADKYLRLAYKTLPSGYEEEKASLIQLLAENMLNRGDARRAGRYRWLLGQRSFYGDNNNFAARILLRTGRVKDAIRLLEDQWAAAGQQPFRAPCSFRESSLILSVCYSYVGEADKAIVTAEQGIEAGERMNSPFVVAVGHYRKAHALLLKCPEDRAAIWAAYGKSEAVGGPLAIPRSRTEVFQGHCILHGLDRNWEAARKAGLAGIAITEKVGDNWFSAILYHTLGMAAALCGKYDEADRFLEKGRQLFVRCNDMLGQAANLWWQVYLAYRREDWGCFAKVFPELLRETEERGYDFLLTKPSLLGDVGGFSSKPFFQAGGLPESGKNRQAGDEEQPEAGAGFKVSAGMEQGNGRLDIQTLGGLRVWNGCTEGLIQDWRRESAKNLFCLFLVFRHTLLQKEAIIHYLWPEADPASGQRNFKAALHTLQMVLEPDRQPRQAGRFIQRSGTGYRFALTAGTSLDVMEFDRLLAAKEPTGEGGPMGEHRLMQAMALYQGRFLAGEDSFEWVRQEQERLNRLFVQAGDELTRRCIRQKKYEEGLGWAEKVLRQDPCWERSYQYMLWCHGRMDNPVMVARTYKECCRVLEEELGLRPSRQTREIYQKFVR